MIDSGHIDEFIRKTNSRRDLKSRTKLEYERNIRLVPLQLLKLASISRIRRYFENKNLARKTISQRLSICREFFHFANLSFSDEVYKTYSKTFSLKDYFTAEEIFKIIEKCNDSFTISIIIFLVKTGLRINELLNAKMFSNGESIFIKFVGKGKWKEETIKLDGKGLWKYYDDFCETDIRKKNYKRVYRCFSKAKKEAGITSKRKTIHSLRHSFAVFQTVEGVTLDFLKGMMRHEDISTTQIYVNHEPVVIDVGNVNLDNIINNNFDEIDNIENDSDCQLKRIYDILENEE